MRLRPLHLLLIPLLVLPACETITGDGDDGAIAIMEGDPLPLQVGQSDTLTVQDASGSTVSSNQLSWTSSDTSIVAVSAAGVVTAKQRGTAEVRAAMGDAEDAIQVAVSFDAGENEMRINVSGDLDELYVIDAMDQDTEISTYAVGLAVDFLDRSSWNFGYITGNQGASEGSEVAGIVFALPDNLAAGTYTLEAMSDGFDEGDPTSLSTPLAVFYRESGEELFEYRPTSGTLEITTVEIAGPDFAPAGSVVGMATFQADEYEQTYDTSTNEYEYAATGGTVEVDVVFNVPAGTYQVGYMDLSASGGPYASTLSLQTWGDARFDSGFGLELSGWTATGDVDVGSGLYIPAPGSGTFDVSSGIAAYWYDYTESDILLAAAESGTVTFSEYTGPTATAYGVARGTMDLTYAVNEFSSRSPGEVFTVTGTFAVPVAPTEGSGSRSAVRFGGRRIAQ